MVRSAFAIPIGLVCLGCDLPLPDVQPASSSQTPNTNNPPSQGTSGNVAPAAETGFCATKRNALFCADFDESVLPGKWAGQKLSAEAALGVVGGSLVASGKSDAYVFTEDHDIDGKYRLTASVRIDGLPPTKSLNLIVFKTSTNGIETEARVNGTNDGSKLVFRLTTSLQNVNPVENPKTGQLGTVHEIKLEAEPKQGKSSLTVDGENKGLELIKSVFKTSVVARAGAISSPGDGTTVSIDNVFIEDE